MDSHILSQGEMTSEQFALLLIDVSHLIQPLPVTALSPQPESHTEIDPSSHPHVNLILVFSDLTALFEASAPPKGRAIPNHVALKLLFYAAQTLSIPSSIFRALAQEALGQSAVYQKTVAETAKVAGLVSDRKRTHEAVPKIEEI